MPKEFDECVKSGGRVRTIKPKGPKASAYMPICYKGDKSVAGHVKHRTARGDRKSGGKYHI